ncbi:uncharacterized protein LOC132270172 [Cornus florida]|uniref:uncharacterized protein LOC132270172 n=1 Tax=Cornus florida TaxID=4283 RepID=UPI0028971DE0|nr:uncharacterized protein LOC132270172 [Cornus florida]
MVDATTGYERLTFLDAYSSYNQIPMNLNDEEKTSFVTERGIYCYKVMPYGLTNAGATYQRLVSKIFKSQMGKTVEAYIDEMVVKSRKKDQYLQHLQDMFEVLRKYGMKLNPTKCSFLGLLQTVLRHNKRPRRQAWGDEQRLALTRLKEYMQNPPILSALKPGPRVGIKLQTPEGATLHRAIRLEFRATNNEAEYEALLAGPRLAKELKVKSLVAFSDSHLLIRQVTGEYGTKDETIEAYRSAIMHEAKNFDQIKFT